MKLKRVFTNLIAVMLVACSASPGYEASSPVQEEKEKPPVEQKLVSVEAPGDTKAILALLEDGAEINATDHHGVAAVMTETQKTM